MEGRRSEFMLGGIDFKDLKASQIKEEDVIACRPENTWKQIAKLMTDGGFGDIPIIDKDKTLLGIVTEHDLLKVLMEGKDVKEYHCCDVMTKEPICGISQAKSYGLCLKTSSISTTTLSNSSACIWN